MNMSLVLRMPHELHLSRSPSNAPCLPSFLKLPQNPHVLLAWQGAQYLALATRNHIWTSRSGPKPSVFNTFDVEMCFTPQRRALFQHLNFQKCSEAEVFCAFGLRMCFAPQRRALFRHLSFQKWFEHGVLCTFWLPNVLCATMACTFSTSQLPKLLRTWGDFSCFTCKCASRHNGVQGFIPHLARWLRTRRFSEPTFRPSGTSNHWKNTVSRGFPTYSRNCIFFLLTLSTLLFSLTLPISAFHLSILSEVWLLNFLR